MSVALQDIRAPAVRAARMKRAVTQTSPALNMARAICLQVGLDWDRDLQADSKRELIEIGRAVYRAMGGEVLKQEGADHG